PMIDVEKNIGTEFYYISHQKKNSKTEKGYFIYRLASFTLGRQLIVSIPFEKSFEFGDCVKLVNPYVQTRAKKERNSDYSQVYYVYYAEDIELIGHIEVIKFDNK
ncbi:TPA: DUF961 family protein, partial [Staphylococcus aureus]|nr:DUF961 family protein [Staphylococcus aureus]HDE7990243.1 DUF961 family protein [Staphylococcus aureus]HDE8652157.1 DUF961 family protein [Staphylococcus aureus]HDH9553087.1 DUF961 family protein [Staphylococcus aureus]HDJ3662224.1 DUF961 family protein [Staphylococcus aureus]